MNGINMVKGWIGALTDLGLMLLALGIVVGILYGQPLPFVGTGVINNLMGLVKALGDGGLVGLITLGIVVWLFSKRSVG